MQKAVFFDRDGVINEHVYNKEQGTIDNPLHASQVRLVYGVLELIKGVKELGFTTIICSNQPALGLGKTTLKNFQAIKNKIKSLLKEERVSLDMEY